MAAGTPLVSIVVAVRGNVHDLAGLLVGLTGQQELPDDVALEVVVVDNHRRPSPALDAVVGDARASVLPVRVLHEPRPGLSRARNRGIRAARGRFLLIIDPDARPAPGWVAGMVEALEVTGAYCVGGRVLPLYTSTPRPDLGPELEAMFVPPRWPARIEALARAYWLVGCNLGLRRTPLPRFDETFGVRGRHALTCEDLEFVARCEREGLPVVIAPDAVVYRAIHPSDLTMRALLRRGFGHGQSITRLAAVHPGFTIVDSYRLRHVRHLWRTDHTSALVAAARIAGRAVERCRHTHLISIAPRGRGSATLTARKQPAERARGQV